MADCFKVSGGGFGEAGFQEGNHAKVRREDLDRGRRGGLEGKRGQGYGSFQHGRWRRAVPATMVSERIAGGAGLFGCWFLVLTDVALVLG